MDDDDFSMEIRIIRNYFELLSKSNFRKMDVECVTKIDCTTRVANNTREKFIFIIKR